MAILERVGIIRTALLAACAALSAGAATDFSGRWTMNPDKTNFGPLSAGAPKRIERIVRHRDPALAFDTTQSGPLGDLATSMRYTTDGKPAVNTLRGVPVKGAAKWQGDVLVIETVRTNQGIEIRQTDRWSMEPDGKRMRVDSSIQTGEETAEFTVVFDRQESGDKP